MNCAEIKHFMEEFLKGKLGGEKARSIRTHLTSCSHCASALSEDDRIEVLSAMDEEIEPSSDFHARFMSKLEKHRTAQAAGSRSAHQWWSLLLNWGLGRQLVAAGALAALVLIGLYFGINRPGDLAPSPAAGTDIAIAENLPLLQDMKVIENLDFLEDFDTIQNLDANGRPASTVQ